MSTGSPVSGFLTPLRVENIDATTWVLLEPLVWRGSQGDDFVVDAGEETDFATVPWWTQSLIPRTGTWTKAAVVHDKMCRELFRYRRELAEWPGGDLSTLPRQPTFNSVDTDAVFRKNARDEGTGPIRSELLWLGVRYGALANPARREHWFTKTGLRVLVDTIAVLAFTAAMLAGISWAWPW